MEFNEIREKRYSCRSFTEEDVSELQIKSLLEAANSAPSAKNNQAYKIMILKGDDLRRVEDFGRFYNAPLLLVFLADSNSAWVNPYNDKQYIAHDATIATTYAMLEATNLGLNSVFICWFDPQKFIEEFKLPTNLYPLNILAVGHEEKNNWARKRKDIDSLVFSHK